MSAAADGDDQPIAPAVFVLHLAFHRGDQRWVIGKRGNAIGVSRIIVIPCVSDAEAHGGIGADVAHPMGGFALLGDDIEAVLMLHIPDFDRVARAAAAPGGGEVEEFRPVH